MTKACIDCGKPVNSGGGRLRSARCWGCYNLSRVAAPQPGCIDCGAPFAYRKAVSRCRRCWEIDMKAQRVAKTPRSIFHAPHGPIRVPEGHSVYWVRKGECG